MSFTTQSRNIRMCATDFERRSYVAGGSKGMKLPCTVLLNAISVVIHTLQTPLRTLAVHSLEYMRCEG